MGFNKQAVVLARMSCNYSGYHNIVDALISRSIKVLLASSAQPNITAYWRWLEFFYSKRNEEVSINLYDRFYAVIFPKYD